MCQITPFSIQPEHVTDTSLSRVFIVSLDQIAIAIKALLVWGPLGLQFFVQSKLKNHKF